MPQTEKQPNNPVTRASRIGQSIWLDNLSRDLIESGGLKKYIDVGLRGVTSNPKIFASAISEGSAYDGPIKKLARQGKSPAQIYETLAVEDIQAAADQLLPHFEEGLPQDGFVSLEVSRA
ncbi:MAG: transaldolase family protein [Bryobacterales bacterium]